MVEGAEVRIIVTVKSFDDQMSQFDFLIPSMANTMEQLTYRLISLEEPPINVDGLNAIHFTDNYREELFAFQESVGHHSFATKNKIADGYAQVVMVKEGQSSPENVGYHIFVSKLIPMTIMVGQFLEDNPGEASEDLVQNLRETKNEYARMLRHELSHVEDENNQKNWAWLEESFSHKNLQTTLRYDTYRLWEEFYACKRSNFIYDVNSVSREISSMLSNLETAEKEICELRWKYNNESLPLNDFVALFHEYVRSAFIYCCYFMGHMDRIYEYVSDKLQPDLYPSRFYSFMPCMWKALRKMNESYPEWSGPEIYDDLAEIVLKCIEEFEIYPKYTAGGVYYDIPVKHLITKSEEAQKA